MSLFGKKVIEQHERWLESISKQHNNECIDCDEWHPHSGERKIGHFGLCGKSLHFSKNLMGKIVTKSSGRIRFGSHQCTENREEKC